MSKGNKQRHNYKGELKTNGNKNTNKENYTI